MTDRTTEKGAANEEEKRNNEVVQLYATVKLLRSWKEKRLKHGATTQVIGISPFLHDGFFCGYIKAPNFCRVLYRSLNCLHHFFAI